ncbi:MAG: zinc-ribbon domain-containing protein, partial [Thermoplasmata archaeon]|nr:zinc-ribbon domain-containing protein [Thermoplasmata archaeon]
WVEFMPKKLTLTEMQAIAKSRGGECLSKTYVNSNTKLRWRCNDGHEWGAAPGNVKHANWCPFCAGIVRLTIGDMKKLAKDRGGKCLSTEYVNALTKLRWRCKNGHEWEARPNNIKYGRWCPICGNAKKGRYPKPSSNEMQKIAKSRGGKC